MVDKFALFSSFSKYLYPLGVMPYGCIPQLPYPCEIGNCMCHERLVGCSNMFRLHSLLQHVTILDVIVFVLYFII